MNKLLLSFVFVMMATSMFASIWYVKPNSTSTAWADKDLGKTTTDLLQAFTSAAANDEIWLSSGTHYYTGSAVMLFNKNIKLYGGFSGNESSITERQKVANGNPWEYTNTTIIEPASGYLKEFMKTNSGETVLFNGLTFQNFKALVLNIRQNTIVQECVFFNNTSAGDGAAVSMYPGGTVKDCYFLRNTALSSSAVFVNIQQQNATISGSLFEENTNTGTANAGAAINIKQGSGHTNTTNTVLIANCIFRNNTSTVGTFPSIVLIKTPYASLNNCVITNNTGTALDLLGGKASNLTIANNIGLRAVRINHSQAGTTTPKLYNTVVWGNKKSTTDNTLVGIVVEADQRAEVAHIASDVPQQENTATATFSQYTLLDMANSGSADQIKYVNFVSPTLFAGSSADIDNITAIRNANYSMSGTSAIIDLGNSNYIDPTINQDINKNDRFMDKAVDLGAYEVPKFSIGTGVSSVINSNEILYTEIGNSIRVDSPAGQLRLYSLQGQLIVSQNKTTAPLSLTLNKGIYILQLRTDNQQVLVKKLIVK